MAPNDRSNIHDDAYQTDTADLPGPLGRSMSRVSTFYSKECASVTFDSRGRIVTICVGVDRPQLKLLDAGTLAELATMDLPPRQTAPANTFNDFSGGGYFYLDNRDRAVIPTSDRHLLIVGQSGGGFQVAAGLRPVARWWRATTSSSPPCPTGRGGSGWCPPAAW